MKEPCLDCMIRFGTSYTSSCDEYCTYAQAVKQNKELKEEIYSLKEQLREFSILTPKDEE